MLYMINCSVIHLSIQSNKPHNTAVNMIVKECCSKILVDSNSKTNNIIAVSFTKAAT